MNSTKDTHELQHGISGAKQEGLEEKGPKYLPLIH